MDRRKPRDLSGRVREIEIVGGRLILRGTWNEWDRRDVALSIFPEDAKMVEEALERFRAGETEFAALRESRRERDVREKQERKNKVLERRAETAKREAKMAESKGVKIIDIPD